MNAPNVEKHIGQYKILRTLGAGGMGTVYLGEHLLLGRRAAIKTLLPSLSSHREIVDRFFNEARAISAISDPGVVQVFDFGYHVDGTAFIVMEFLEGEALSARLDRLTHLPLLDALRLARQLASSLSAAHDRGIVHRDLKPGNVFVIRDNEVPGGERTKILDFGICKLGDDEAAATATQTGTMLGTPVYMSPEQCRGAGRVDHRSDIYSLGCVLFHMVTGRPPFDCESVGDYIASHIKDAAPAPSSVSSDLPPVLDGLMARCLAKEPDERFQSMAELQHAIEQVLAQLSDSGAKAVGAPKFLATPLGEGFQSSYDVNLGNKLRTVDATPSPPSHPWFVDSLLPVEISIDDDHYELPPRRGRWGRRLALFAALALGVAGGLAGTQYVLDEQEIADAAAPTSPELVPSEDAAPSYSATVAETAPPEPIAEATPVADVTTPPKQPVPPKKSEAARARHTRQSKPARPRPVVREQKPQVQEPEDLYDTR